MVVVPLDRSCGLLETDVIEASKGGSADVFDGVVWDQELFLLQPEDRVELSGEEARADERNRRGQVEVSSPSTS